jgi:hypothetical protein
LLIAYVYTIRDMGYMSRDNEMDIEPDCSRKGMAWVDFTEKPKRRKKIRRRIREGEDWGL